MNDYSTPKAMKRVGDLFESYKKRLKAPQATVEKTFIEVTKEVTGFTLQKSQVSYTVSTRTISLQVPSILKSELSFQYEAILKQLEQTLGQTGCPKKIR